MGWSSPRSAGPRSAGPRSAGPQSAGRTLGGLGRARATALGSVSRQGRADL